MKEIFRFRYRNLQFGVCQTLTGYSLNVLQEKVYIFNGLTVIHFWPKTCESFLRSISLWYLREIHLSVVSIGGCDSKNSFFRQNKELEFLP